jgi:hypothetical protein
LATRVVRREILEWLRANRLKRLPRLARVRLVWGSITVLYLVSLLPWTCGFLHVLGLEVCSWCLALARLGSLGHPARSDVYVASRQRRLPPYSSATSTRAQLLSFSSSSRCGSKGRSCYAQARRWTRCAGCVRGCLKCLR